MLSQLVFTKKLNTLYKSNEFKDHSPLGLIVEGREKVQKGITAVSFSLEVVEKAVIHNADFIVVHHPHGFWNNQSRQISLGFKQKLSLLLKHDINLYSYHLPMDSQPKIGNNIGVLKALNLSLKEGFLPMGSHFIGLVGTYDKPIPYKKFKNQIESNIGHINFDFHFGTKEIQTVAVCTGGAAGSILQALETKADIFITGEAKEDTFIFCKDYQFNFIAAGHHKTEVFGPKLLAEFLTQEWNISTTFVNILNPV